MQMRRHILLSEVEGKPAVCFDTGLEPRSFARTKMSQSLIEQGYIVKPDGSNEVWKASGVCEFGSHMRVWGKHFSGERFDSILFKEKKSQTALEAVVYWMKAKLYLGDKHSTLNPSATFIGKDGSVFFSPPNLANRCLHVEGLQTDYFSCPDLLGMDAVAFCAGAMLYKTLSGNLPYASNETMYQDMREGVLLPVSYAVPELNKKLSHLIQSALYLPVEKKTSSQGYIKKSMDIISGMISLLTEKKSFSIVKISSLFSELSAEEKEKHEKEKKSFSFKQNAFVKTRRFAAKNKFPIIAASAVLLFVLFIAVTTSSGIKNRPTTAGMMPDSVIFAYYNAFSHFDHVFMEQCAQGSDPVIKSDINAAAGFYAVAATRRSYGANTLPPIITARAWKDAGNELPAPDVFGVTDITLEYITGSDSEKMVIYRVNYDLWAPNEHARNRTDIVTLRHDRRGNWRMTEILRTER